MRDVARKAAVSITTVSHVLNETRPVAEETRKRVLRAAAALNYFKNTSARLLVRGQSDLIGLIISDIENPFFPELIKSFETACAGVDMEMLLGTTNYDPSHEKSAVARMLENRVRGVAVMTSQFSPEMEALFVNQKIPVVRIGSGPIGPYRSTISLDYRGGLTEAVRHLHGLGHERIALATGPLRHVSARDYKRGALRVMKRMMLEPFQVAEGDHEPESGARITKELLESSRRPTAILCGNDRMAIGAVRMAASLGFSVPADISVVGADDIWMTRYSHPSITTIRIPRDLLGRLALDALNEIFDSKHKLGAKHVLGTSLIVRDSTGPAHGSDD